MGQEISWQHIWELYERNFRSTTNCGVPMVHKLTLEHINLTSFSKMRVDLAAQVHMLKLWTPYCNFHIYIYLGDEWDYNKSSSSQSETVTKALLLTGGSEAFEPSVFIGKVDQFFDALNMTNYTKGIKARTPFQKPYFNKDDPRLEASIWNLGKKYASTKGLLGSKKLMVLSRET